MWLLLFAACASDGAAVYESTCAGCHGADGSLGVVVNGVASPDLAELVPAMSDDELTTVIEEGSGVMPPQLTKGADVRAVLAYLRDLYGE